MKRFLLADDHAIIRYALSNILRKAFPDAEIVEVEDAEDLLKKVIQHDWDVVVSDISMPGRSGLETLHQIRQTHPKLPVLILSMYAEELYALRIIKAGGSGYLQKDSAMEELVVAVQTVLSGKKYITPAIAEQLALSFDTDTEKALHESLNDREFEIAQLLGAGMNLTDVARKLSLSVTTIGTYRAKILKVLQLETNADLTRYAIEHKLL